MTEPHRLPIDEIGVTAVCYSADKEGSMGKKKKKKAEEEPGRKVLCSRGELWQPRPAPKLDEYDRPAGGDDPDASPYENDD